MRSPFFGEYGAPVISSRDAVSALIRPSHPAPLLKEGGSPYETHHSVVGHHGPNPVGGKRGGTGGGDRLRRSTKLGRWAGPVHPEGYQRCPSGRHYRGQGSSSRGCGDPQGRDKAARRGRRDR